MEEFADAKEDENKKIVHTYPLVQVSVLTPEVMLNIYLCQHQDFGWGGEKLIPNC